MRYTSIKTGKPVEIDVATATLDELFDAYDSLLARSVFPAKTAKRYADELRALMAARPDLVEYHKERGGPALTARIGCSCAPKRNGP